MKSFDGSAVEFDVVIVGAGPAGLACASALSGLKVLILERESRCGGRIATANLGGQPVDMGASFAFEPACVPEGLSIEAGRLVKERSELGISHNGAVHFGATALDCLKGMHLDREVFRRIDAFSRDQLDVSALRSDDAYALLNSLLHQIHPGELEDYDSSHQRDGLYTWYPDHWERGNQALVDALLSKANAQLLLNAEVRNVSEDSDAVEAGYSAGGKAHRVKCSAAVIAVTADVAASLLPSVGLRYRRLFDATRYAGYIVVALAGVKASQLREFRCVVSVSRSLAAVMQQRTADRSSAVLLCYYCGPGLQELAAIDDEALIARTWQELSPLGLHKSVLDAGVETSVKRWTAAGTVLSTEFLECGSEPWERVSDRIYLAGDYVSVGRGTGYGIADAVASGVHAARAVRAAIKR